MSKPATVLDRATVVTVLYVAPFDHADLTDLPLVQLREYVRRMSIGLGAEVGRLTAGIASAADRGASWLDVPRLHACENTATALFRYRRTTGAPVVPVVPDRSGPAPTTPPAPEGGRVSVVGGSGREPHDSVVPGPAAGRRARLSVVRVSGR